VGLVKATGICIHFEDKRGVNVIVKIYTPSLDIDYDDINETRRYLLEEINTLRADLSAEWTLIYQGTDILIFLLISSLPIFAGISVVSVVGGLGFVGIGTALLGLTFDSFDDESDEVSWSQVLETVMSVPRQFVNDSRAGLLAPFVFGFGITTAMFCYYVNFTVISSSSALGTASIGLFESFSYLVAIAAAYPYAYVSNNVPDGRHFVMQFGSAAFCMCGVAVFCLSNEQLSVWWVMLIIKGFYGLGRGVFEGSCRAVYADLFSGEDLSTAFSGQTLLAGFSGGACFFMYGWLQKESIATVTMVNGVLALVAYALLMRLDSSVPVTWSTAFSTMFSWLRPSDLRPSARIPLSHSFSGLPNYSLIQMNPENEDAFVTSLSSKRSPRKLPQQ